MYFGKIPITENILYITIYPSKQKGILLYKKSFLAYKH